MNRFSKVLVILGALLVWYALFGFLIAPALIRHFGEKALRENFSPESAIAKVRINPFSGSFRVEGLSLKDATDAWSVVWDEAELNMSGATLVKFYPVIDVIRLDGADVRFEKRLAEDGDELAVIPEESGSGDWREMVESLNLAEIPELRIDLLEVTNGIAEFSDLTEAEPFSKTIDPINFTLSDLTTVVEGDSQMRFLAQTADGASLTWEGDFRSQPIRSAGRLSLDGLQIHDLSPYYTEFIRFDLKQALFGLEFEYEIDLANIDALFALRNGQVRLSELNCVPSDGADRLISIDSLVLDAIEFEFPAMNLQVGHASIQDGATLVAKEPDGQINLAQLFAIPEQPEIVEPDVVEVDAQGDGLPALSYYIDEVSVQNYRVMWQDMMEAETANLDVLINVMKVSGYSSDTAKPFRVSADYQIGETGSARLDGEVTSEGPVIDVDFEVSELPLELLSPYGESYGKTAISSGLVDFNGAFFFELGGRQSLRGDASVKGVDLRYDGSLKAKWDSLDLGGLDFQLSPVSLMLDSVILNSPDLDYADVASKIEEPVEEMVRVGVEVEQSLVVAHRPVQIDRIVVKQGRARYVDTSLEPLSEIKLDAFELELVDLNLAEDQPAAMNLTTRLNGSEVKMQGTLRLNQFKEATQVEASLSGLALPQFSAYSGKAIGRRIANGRMDLNADWMIQDSQLKAKNTIVIDQFKLGDRIESESAVNLPIDLAVTLLKGPNGVMDLSLPLSGDLSDPKVSIGQIVRTALVGLITNVASAPFKMLSGIVGSEEDLSTVNFQPGEAVLPVEMIARLNTLSTALKERPGLKLAITPQISAADRERLAEAQLRVELLGDAESSDEKLFRKRLTKRYREAMKIAGTPDRETQADDDGGLETMLAALIPGVELSETDVAALAAARAIAVREHLMTAQGIAAERLSIQEPEVDASESGARFELE